MAQITLDGKVVEEKSITRMRRCSYPECDQWAVDIYKGLPLCAKHLQMIKFVDWCLNNLGGGSSGQEVGVKGEG